jgi:hypothetical protein
MNNDAMNESTDADTLVDAQPTDDGFSLPGEEEFCEVCEEARWTEIVLIPGYVGGALVCAGCAEAGIEDGACEPMEDRVVRRSAP